MTNLELPPIVVGIRMQRMIDERINKRRLLSNDYTRYEIALHEEAWNIHQEERESQINALI